MGIHTYCYVYYVNQGGGIPLQSVCTPSCDHSQNKSQLEIFSIVHYISLIYMVKLVKVKRNFSDRTYNSNAIIISLVKILTTVAARSTDCSGMPPPWLMYVSPGR